MKLWIDDCRLAPEGYKWVKTVSEAKTWCCQHIDPNRVLHIEEFNLDHDAGDYKYGGGDYIELLNWLEIKQNCYNWIINSTFKIHSMNPVGVQNMRAIIQHNGWKEVI